MVPTPTGACSRRAAFAEEEHKRGVVLSGGLPAVHADVRGQLPLLGCELAAEARGRWLLWQTLHINLLVFTLDLKERYGVTVTGQAGRVRVRLTFLP
jgi:hypothetical protein